MGLGGLLHERRLKVENGNIRDLLQLLVRNPGAIRAAGITESRTDAAADRARLARSIACPRQIVWRTSPYRPFRRLYDLFLARTGNIPAPIFPPGCLLEEAQAAKKRHIAAS